MQRDAADDDEDQDYVSYGTRIEEEGTQSLSSWKKTVHDPTLLKSLPVWKQEPTDEEGRKVRDRLDDMRANQLHAHMNAHDST